MNNKKYLIGEKFLNSKGFEFEIIGYSEKIAYREIRFKSGYETTAKTCHIKTGKVRDHFGSTVNGIGIMDMPRNCNELLYNRWVSMINRCYRKDSKNYNNYGERGVYVCDRWLSFSNYIYDISHKENYEKLIKFPNKWQIDKDILLLGNKCYSNETTIIVSVKENIIDMAKKRDDSYKCRPVLQYSLDGKLINEYKSIIEASRVTNINRTSIGDCCRNKKEKGRGYIWKFKD